MTVTTVVDEKPNEAEKMEPYDNWDDFSFHHSSRKVNLDWILLDNCSTTDTFCNRKNNRPSDTTLKIHCNDGLKEVNQVGTLNRYGTV
jgi:hypothetical protein